MDKIYFVDVYTIGLLLVSNKCNINSSKYRVFALYIAYNSKNYPLFINT